jgi:hypothetical protein
VNPSGVHVFKRGDIVKMFFDTGAFGAQILFGLVVKAGPKAYVVVWESRLRNRLEQGRQIVALVEDTELLEEARKGLRRAGVLKETGVRPDAR